jgi:hypothetical protein
MKRNTYQTQDTTNRVEKISSSYATGKRLISRKYKELKKTK